MATSWPRAVLLTRSLASISLKNASKSPTHRLWDSNSATSRNAGIFSRFCNDNWIFSGLSNGAILEGEALVPLDIGATPFQFLTQHLKIRMILRRYQSNGVRRLAYFHLVTDLHS